MPTKKVFVILAGLITSLTILPHACAGGLAESRFVLPEYSKKISMDFKKAQLNDVLKIFSQQSGLNFIAAQDVTSKEVTLYLDKVPVEEALERILSANNLTYEIQPGSDIFLVKPVKKPALDLITRVYPLQYATVSSSKLLQTISIEGGSSSSGSTGNGIIPALKAVISESGKIIEDPRTNSLVITDIPSQFPLIEQTIARLDVPVPQILIEVEMLDISKTTGDQIGIKYGSTPLTFRGGQRDHLYPWNQNEILQAKRFEFTATNEFRVGTIDASGLQATLQFIRSQSDTKNLARPRILTLNNETAEIKIATNEAIGLSQNTTSSAANSTAISGAERVKTGVFLNVTPQANLETGEITIAIAPRVIQARTGATFGTQTFKDPEERGTKSILIVKSGETIILGGLLRTDTENTVVKITILGDIPFIGGAFRHRDKSNKDRELIIFITPHIVSPSTLAATNLPAAPSYESLTREQDIPETRLNEIEKALTVFERKNL